MMEGVRMPPGRGGKWHKEAASVPYWFGKSIRGAHFIPVYLCICHSAAHLKRCQLAAWEAGNCSVSKHLKGNAAGESMGLTQSHRGQGAGLRGDGGGLMT